MNKEQRLDSAWEFFRRVIRLGFKAKYENNLATKEKKTMEPVAIYWVVPRSKEMALENLIMDWFFTKNYRTGPEAFILNVGISKRDNPGSNRCMVYANFYFKNDISTDAKRQIMLSLREFIRKNFDFSDNSSYKRSMPDDERGHETITRRDEQPVTNGGKSYDEVLSELDRHYESIGGTCSYDENGHVCWNSKVGCCGSATMIPW